MRSSTRLFVNTLTTLIRMALTVVLGLVATRLALGQLGNERFGLIGVLGAAGALLSAISDALNFAVMRHLAVDLGRGDMPKLHRAFSTAVMAFPTIALVAGLLGCLAAPLVTQLVKIPPGLESAGLWVFLMTIARLVATISATPFRAILMAHQQMLLIALADVLTSLMMLAAAGALTLISSGEKMLWYAGMLAGGSIGVELVVAGIVWVRFAHLRVRWSLFSWPELSEIWRVGVWTFIANVGWQIRNQGSQFILNGFFGVRANAAYSVAMQTASYQNNLSTSVFRATEPMVMRSTGSGDRATVHRLTIIQGKYAAIAALSFVGPVVVESAQLLRLWLGEGYPTEALVLVPMMVTAMWLQVIGHSLISPVMATGVVGPFTRDNAVCEVVGMGLSVLVLSLASPGVWALPAVIIGIVLSQMLLRTIYVQRQCGLRASEWARRTLSPVLMTAGVSVGLGMLVRTSMPESVLRLALVVLVCTAALVAMGWGVCVEDWERAHFRRLIGSVIAKVRPRRG